MNGLIGRDGKRYRPTLRYEVVTHPDGIEFRPQYSSGQPVREIINTCEHCGRGDWQEVVYRSFEEAVENGLFVEVT